MSDVVGCAFNSVKVRGAPVEDLEALNRGLEDDLFEIQDSKAFPEMSRMPVKFLTKTADS